MSNTVVSGSAVGTGAVISVVTSIKPLRDR
jgi:hypothetical protein